MITTDCCPHASQWDFIKYSSVYKYALFLEILSHGELLVLMEYRFYVPAHSHLSVGQSLRQIDQLTKSMCKRRGK